MKINEENIEKLHFEHKLWQSEANFYRDELKIYKEHVQDIGDRNSSDEVKEKIKYFDDSFEEMNNEITSLLQEIAEHENKLASIEKNEFEGIGTEDTDSHDVMRKNFLDFKNKYTELKNEFRQFSEKWI